MKTKRIIVVGLTKILPSVVGLLVLVGVIAFLAGMMVEKIEPGQSTLVARRLEPDQHDRVYVVQEVTKDIIEEAIGTLKAASRTQISARVLAPINAVHVRAGQSVKTGDVLIELDSRVLEARRSQAKSALQAAESALRQATNEHDRAKRLLPENAISRAAFDQRATGVEVAQAHLDQARQAVDEAEVMLSYATIKAPKRGVIVDRLAEEGDTTQPGKPLLILYDPGSLRLEVPVTERLAVRLKTGDALVVQIDALDNRRIQAVIDEIVPQAEAASRSFLVKVGLPRSEDLFEGMFGRLMIPAGRRKFLCLHVDAIETIGQLPFVDVVGSDDTLQRRMIKVGRAGDAKHREVLSGLKAGERVLLKSARMEMEGSGR